MYAVDLAVGPGSLTVSAGNPTAFYSSPKVTKILAGQNLLSVSNSFLGHPVAVDKDLDYRTDVIYVGRTRRWCAPMERKAP